MIKREWRTFGSSIIRKPNKYLDKVGNTTLESLPDREYFFKQQHVRFGRYWAED